MFIGPEKLAEMFGKGSNVNRCAGCPFAGMCAPCKPTAVKSEVSVFKPGKPTTLETKVGVTGSLSFRPVGEIVRPVSLEKNCSQCGKNPITCHCKSLLRSDCFWVSFLI